ncbi:cyanophycinase [Kangiella spongicola]|jgi:cyanophycinase|uniref:Cyanophycinase n=1 Tax=Kangiella spongicola TaxID=796379 RepID=A0A318D0E7_9GAMM|nr:cyanophycinase [Kangiella spongicola]MBV36408.1 cyanophycinase [Rickettsiales bacterium]PXF62666.1 cyanophycinase [Kangiella spongicola]
MPSLGSGKFDRGYIISIGGCKHQLDDLVAEQIRSICLSASASAVIVNVGPSSIEHKLDKVLTSNGFEDCVELNISSRQDANNPKLLEQMSDKELVIILGEKPLQISTIIGGTPVAKQIRKLNADGVHVVGSYGAAALLSEHMIAGGEESVAPKQDGVTMAPGLGLTNRFMLDYHFEQPGRLGRLLTALSYNPFTIGIGIDEGSALFISPKDELQIFGQGSATLIDPSNLQYSSMGTAGSGDYISLFGLQMHILAPGSRFKAADSKAYDEHWA